MIISIWEQRALYAALRAGPSLCRAEPRAGRMCRRTSPHRVGSFAGWVTQRGQQREEPTQLSILMANERLLVLGGQTPPVHRARREPFVPSMSHETFLLPWLKSLHILPRPSG